MKTKIIITIDTEVAGIDKNLDTPDKHIFGLVNGKEYGINYIMNQLNNYGLKGTFFLNIYDHKLWGNNLYRDIIKLIKINNFDIQLHTHVEKLKHFTGAYKKNISQFTMEEQKRIINYGQELFYSLGGISPTWHRAGNLGANFDTLRACKETGLIGDSSFAYDWSSCAGLSIHKDKRNDIQKIEGIIELPITTFQTLYGIKNYRHYDINVCTLNELKFITNQAINNEIEYLVFLMHSLSFVKRKNGVYEVRKKDLVKFSEYLNFISSQEKIQTISLSDINDYNLYENKQKNTSLTKNLKSGYILTYERSLEQWNMGYKNKIFALLPIIIFIFFVLILTLKY